MRFFKSKKAIALIVTLVVAAASAFGAYAYFTDGGSGTGTGNIGEPTAFQISATLGGNLYPGNSTPVTYSVYNPGNANEYLNTITLTGVKVCSNNNPGNTSAWNPAMNAGAGGCSNGGTELTSCESFSSTYQGDNWYLAPAVEHQDLYIHAQYGPSPDLALNVPTGTLYFEDIGNQDTCEGAAVYLEFTSN